MTTKCCLLIDAEMLQLLKYKHNNIITKLLSEYLKMAHQIAVSCSL